MAREMALALRAAIEAAGGIRALAKACEVTYQAVHKWLKRGRVPLKKVLVVEAATGVSRHRLGPDFYPAPVPATAA